MATPDIVCENFMEAQHLASTLALYKLCKGQVRCKYYNCFSLLLLIFTIRNSSCGKIMFSQACVKNSVQGGGVHPPRQTPLKADSPLADTPWPDTSPRQTSRFGRQLPLGRPPPPPRRPLQRTVRILLEWILVLILVIGE